MPAESLTKHEIAAAVLGTAVLLISLASEFLRAMGTLACCLVPFAWLGALALAASASTPKKTPILLLLIVVQSALTAFVCVHLMGGIPYYVHHEADPLIAEIRQYHDMYDSYPPGGGRPDRGDTPAAMRPYLNRQAWCFYVSSENDCRVDCHSIGFNHAVYTFSTDSWWVGD